MSRAIEEFDVDASTVDRPDGAVRFSRHDRWTLASVVVAIGIVAALVWAEAETEPYHIDELRQVRPYALGLDQLLDGSFSQEQPPLDVLVGAAFQRVLGVGDVLQRGHSMVAGVAALAFLAALLWRYRVREGIPIAILTLGLNPAYLSFTAYARPYALPLALMLGFLLSTDTWLNRGSRWSAAVLALIAVVLPLSRVFEPPAFLILVSVTILLYRRWNPEWQRRMWWPIGSSLLALVLVEIPVYLRLQDRLTAYQGDDVASLSEQFRRVIDDSLPRFADVLIDGRLALLLAAIAIATPGVRRQLRLLWWFWPLLLTAVAFALAFHVRTQPGQPFYDRYGYFWLPSFAVAVGLTVQAIVERTRTRPWTSGSMVIVSVVSLIVLAYGASLVSATAGDIGSTTRADYRSLGREIESRLPISTAVVFDTTTVPLGSYRPGFAGYGRYTSPLRWVPKAEALIAAGGSAEAVDAYAIATQGPVLEVDGWTAVPASEKMTLYLPDETRSGPRQLAEDLELFGTHLDPQRGATLRLAAASILINIGEVEAGCDLIERVIAADPSIEPAVERALNRSEDAVLVESCPGG